jgi:putative FmdB family regulatory protein
MPFYEYQCEKCSEIYEFFIRNGEKIPDNCEICGGKLHKIISVSSFHLKGSGWYITDYAKKNSPSTENGVKKDNYEDNSNKGSTDKEVKPTTVEAKGKKVLKESISPNK